jgi:circadian clock protein KaiB
VNQPSERNSGPRQPAAWAEGLKLRLYIAGQAPNSLRALASLDAIRRDCGLEQVDLEVMDVLLEPLRALDDRILVTPTLIKLAPPPVVRIAGDLSHKLEVMLALGLTPRVDSEGERHSG